MDVEWDADKDASNVAKHGVGFAFAARAFASRTIQWRDRRSDYGEARWCGLVEIDSRVYVVVWTMRGPDRFRLISARKANERETQRYRRETRVAESLPDRSNEP